MASRPCCSARACCGARASATCVAAARIRAPTRACGFGCCWSAPATRRTAMRVPVAQLDRWNVGGHRLLAGHARGHARSLRRVERRRAADALRRGRSDRCWSKRRRAGGAIVASDTPGCREVVRHGRRWPPGPRRRRPRRSPMPVERLLGDRALRAAMGRCGRERGGRRIRTGPDRRPGGRALCLAVAARGCERRAA